MTTQTFGIDFGTSNSAVAVRLADGTVRIAQWQLPAEVVATSGRNKSETVPTVLFAPHTEKQLYVGHEAIARYLSSDLDGRFIQSIKSFLSQRSFTHTIVGGKRYSIEELVAHILREVVAEAEKTLGMKIEGRVVFGRPTFYSLTPEEDLLAETRMRTAAKLAGLGDIEMIIEPVAAALAYEAQLNQDETVLVVDLGGGTSDFTLMRVGPSQRGAADRKTSILASGGLPLAGDCIDGEIVRARLFDVLGFGSNYVVLTGKTEVPKWLWHKLQRWHHVSFLKDREYLEFLRRVHETSDQPDQIEALLQIVEEDMGYLLFRAVERAKREVAEKDKAFITDPKGQLPMKATLTKRQFAQATQWLVDDITQTARDVLAQAGLSIQSVDTVFMTGGTSYIPEIANAFAGLFGAAKLRREGMFTSVVDGLARG